tara:strand:- start:582 stop:701 length:120 start_codon:yes stop_codon:yes gene_type:complete
MDNVSTSYDLEVSYIYEENHLDRIMTLIIELVTKLSLAK